MNTPALPPTHIGDVIRKLREQRDWSQPELARRAKTGIMTVSEIERAERPNPKTGTLDKLARALGLESAAALYHLAQQAPSPTRATVAAELREIGIRLVSIAAVMDEAEGADGPAPPGRKAKRR